MTLKTLDCGSRRKTYRERTTSVTVISRSKLNVGKNLLAKTSCSCKGFSVESLLYFVFEMDILELLPSSFGYVILTFIYSWIMLTYLGLKVGGARKKYDVKYPTMYSDKDQVFNCIQRAHQNTLEVYPQWLVFQTITALVYPMTAAVLGAIWVTSRFSYAWGYYTGDPAKRMNGAYGYIGYLGVIIISIYVALQLLGVF